MNNVPTDCLIYVGIILVERLCVFASPPAQYVLLIMTRRNAQPYEVVLANISLMNRSIAL